MNLFAYMILPVPRPPLAATAAGEPAYSKMGYRFVGLMLAR
jgi:hypothetical protein